MKNKYLIIILFLLSVCRLNAQNCNFSYNIHFGTTIVDFLPNSVFSPNNNHFVWDFHDGTIDSTYNPTHTFNSNPPYNVCCTIYDNLTNNIACWVCDSNISTHTSSCNFTYTLTGNNGVLLTTSAPLGDFVVWTFGDTVSTPLQGNPSVAYNYQSAGTYTVCMTTINAFGDTCISCGPVTVGNISTNCSFVTTPSGNPPFVFNFAATAVFGSTISWTFGDGTVDNGANVTHTYNSIGTYTVCMTVVEPNGAICTSCDVVLVGSTHGNCFFSYGVDTTNQNTINFTASPATIGDSIAWDFGDGSIGSGDITSHTYASNGTYTVTMTEYDSNGALFCTSPLLVTIGAPAVCNFTASLDPNTLMSYNFNVNSGFFTSITWDFGDGTTGLGQNAQHTYSTAGVYIACVSVAGGGFTCQSCDTIYVGNNTGNCSYTYFQAPPSNAITFVAQPVSSFNFIHWDFNDGTTTMGITVNHIFTQPGTYYVCMIEDSNSNGGEVCRDCQTIVIPNSQPNCQASFISASLGLTTYFIDQSIPASNSSNTSYNWDFGDGSSSQIRFAQHVYANPGLYTACLTITSANCTDQYCAQVLADSSVHNPMFCTAMFAVVQLAPFQLSVVNLSSGVNLSFLWNFGDGTSDTQPYPSHFYSSTGSYNLCLTVYDSTGCQNTFCDTISVDTLGNVFRTQAGFTVNVVSPSQLIGVNEISSVKSFRAFPNPVTNDLHVNLISGVDKAAGFRILSLQGSEVLSGHMNGTEARINMQSLSAGTYMLEVTLTDGSKSYQSIVKN